MKLEAESRTACTTMNVRRRTAQCRQPLSGPLTLYIAGHEKCGGKGYKHRVNVLDGAWRVVVFDPFLSSEHGTAVPRVLEASKRPVPCLRSSRGL